MHVDDVEQLEPSLHYWYIKGKILLENCSPFSHKIKYISNLYPTVVNLSKRDEKMYGFSKTYTRILKLFQLK